MTIKEQGTGGPGVLNPIDNPVHSLSYRIESQSGTQVFVRGQANAGSVPNNFHLFSSFVEEINNYPAYNSIATYFTGMRIIDAGIISLVREFKSKKRRIYGSSSLYLYKVN